MIQRLSALLARMSQALSKAPVMAPVAKAPPTRSKTRAVKRDEPSADLMRRELRELLQRHPAARSVLRHLSFVERGLRRKGVRALNDPPVEVLQAALAQLESLVTNWEPKGLAELRSRLAVAIGDRERRADGLASASERSRFLDEQRVLVSDTSDSVFREAQANWAMPAAKPA